MKVIIEFKSSGIFRDDIKVKLDPEGKLFWVIDSDKIKEIKTCP